MCTGDALFAGECEIAVMFKIFQLLGTPRNSMRLYWPHLSEKFPQWNRSEAEIHNCLFDLIICRTPTIFSPAANSNHNNICSRNKLVSLVRNMLNICPSKRIASISVAEEIKSILTSLDT